MAKPTKTDAKLYKKIKTVKGVEYESWVARQYHNGKPVECSASTQIEALQRLAQKINDIDSGAVGISGKMTVKRWSETWLEIYKKPSVTEKSYRGYVMYIKFINQRIGQLKLTEVTDIHLQSILNERAEYSYSEIKHLNDTIKALFLKARQSGLILKDPSETLEKPKSKKGRGRAITEFERKHILKIANEHPAGLMFLIMLYAGLRPGEVCALDWRHIDFANSQIRVEQAVESGSNRIKETKTECGFRVVPMRKELHDRLLAIKGDPFEPIFKQVTTGLRHTEASRDKAWHSFKKMLDDSMGAQWDKEKAKDGKMRLKKVLSVVASDLVPYCLRHTFGTDCEKQGIPLNYIKTMMGHSDISVTSGTYIHTENDTIKESFVLAFHGEKHGENQKQA